MFNLEFFSQIINTIVVKVVDFVFVFFILIYIEKF